MGLLDAILTANIAANMTTDYLSDEMETTNFNNELIDKTISLSSEKSYLDCLNINSIFKDNFEKYKDNILQITKTCQGYNHDTPLYFTEVISKDELISDITIVPNKNCYQKQYVNSSFCALTFNEIGEMAEQKQRYKILKIHTEPINIEKGKLKTDLEVYICEIAIL